MGKFMAEHSRELSFSEDATNSFGHSDGGVLWISAGCKSIRRFLRNYINAGHRQIRLLGKLLDKPIELGIVVCGYLLSLVHRDDHFVAKPVAKETSCAGHHERDNHTLLTA